MNSLNVAKDGTVTDQDGYPLGRVSKQGRKWHAAIVVGDARSEMFPRTITRGPFPTKREAVAEIEIEHGCLR